MAIISWYLAVITYIKEPRTWEEKQQAYYFCEDPECDMVYFGQDNSVIKISALRTTAGIKSLDEVGTSIWQAMQENNTLKDVLETLLEYYQVDSDVLEKDLLSFVDKLVESGIVELN